MAFSLYFHHCSPEFQTEITTFVKDWQNGTELLSVKTSGSTGTPKEIILQRQTVEQSARRSNAFFQLSKSARVLLCLSPATIGGKMVLIRALTGNYTVHIVEPARNPLTFIDQDTSFDFVSLVPFQVNEIADQSPHRLAQFNTILLGGSPLSDEKEQELLQLHTNCYIGFGMTETVSHIALRKTGEKTYTCLEGVTVSQVNELLCVSDTILGIDQLVVNDAVNILDEQHFEWLGRTDFVINSGGIKIHPELLEKALAHVIPFPFMVGGIPDETLGQRCILIVDAPENAVRLETVQQHCLPLFGKYAVPKAIFYHSLIELNGTKINRSATLAQIDIRK